MQSAIYASGRYDECIVMTSKVFLQVKKSFARSDHELMPIKRQFRDEIDRSKNEKNIYKLNFLLQ